MWIRLKTRMSHLLYSTTNQQITQRKMSIRLEWGLNLIKIYLTHTSSMLKINKMQKLCYVLLKSVIKIVLAILILKVRILNISKTVPKTKTINFRFQGIDVISVKHNPSKMWDTIVPLVKITMFARNVMRCVWRRMIT
jgi:hypothetical protein